MRRSRGRQKRAGRKREMDTCIYIQREKERERERGRERERERGVHGEDYEAFLSGIVRCYDVQDRIRCIFFHVATLNSCCCSFVAFVGLRFSTFCNACLRTLLYA